MRKLGIPLWLKSEAKLKQLVEIIAKNEYKLFLMVWIGSFTFLRNSYQFYSKRYAYYTPNFSLNSC